MYILSVLAPIFFIVGVGFALRRGNFFDDLFFQGCARITYWVGLPCLLLVQIAGSDFNMDISWRIFVVMFAATLILAVLATMLAFALRLDPNRGKTFIHTSFHCNTAFVGLPVLMVALVQAVARQDLMDMASMALAPTVPVVNILSILVLRGTEIKCDRGLAKMIFQKILMNPLVLACLGGMLLSFLRVSVPIPVERSLSALGKMSIPLALLSIGAGLQLRKMSDGVGAAVLASFLNVAVLPLVGYVLCRMWGFSTEHTLIALIILACPTASSAYIYARQIAGDTAFAASVIMISTLMSAISLSVVLFFFGI